ncbi:MAG: PqqD family protein [Desulfobacteraceae bacterium]|nr:PqqD family protein [Desulfobacteraceae bacterium]MBC2757478.1 PqqD family protein [Desulfobacteraceae bacterium]
MTVKILAKELESELMLHDTEKDEVHVLNATARLIYKLCREGKDLTEITQEVRRRFQLGGDQAMQRDVQGCIEELRKKGLLPIDD